MVDVSVLDVMVRGCGMMEASGDGGRGGVY